MPFEITPAQRERCNPLFAPVVAGAPPANLAVQPTRVVIDASADPGVQLVATFAPATPAAPGVRRVAGLQKVTATVVVAFDAILPLYWMASVFEAGDMAPNQMTTIYTADSDDFTLPFAGEVTIVHEGGAWVLPSYDSTIYTINVGFGIGTGLVAWAYSVPCQPRQTIALTAGAYQIVRSDGAQTIGSPILASQEAWAMPIGFDYALTFDARGNGILSKT